MKICAPPPLNVRSSLEKQGKLSECCTQFTRSALKETRVQTQIYREHEIQEGPLLVQLLFIEAQEKATASPCRARQTKTVAHRQCMIACWRGEATNHFYSAARSLVLVLQVHASQTRRLGITALSAASRRTQ